MMAALSAVLLFAIIKEYRFGTGVACKLDVGWFASVGQPLQVGVYVAYEVTSRSSFGIYEAIVPLGLVVVGASLSLSYALLSYASQLTLRYSKTWIKFLDFPYLALAFSGLVRVVNSSPQVTKRYETLDSLGMILLALALAIRLSKATLEVFFDRRIARGQQP